MKKMLILLFVLLSINSHAQFSLTKEGFINTEDNAKNYVVIEFEDMPKDELYLRTLKYVTSTYKSAKDVVSKVDNEMITLNGSEPNKILAKTIRYDISYNVTISFKDNKIKIDAPTFECSSFSGGKPYRLTMSGSNGGFGSEVTIGLFKKNGEASLKNTIIEIESFFNGLVSGIKGSINGNQDEW